jgi:hypothetical protein
VTNENGGGLEKVANVGYWSLTMVLVSYYGDGCFLIWPPSWKINIAFPFSPAVCIGSVQ